MKRALFLAMITAFAFLTVSCSPEVGSKAWCEQMKEKPKADWTASEAKDYAEYCLFK
jgi:hypothetical protein